MSEPNLPRKSTTAGSFCRNALAAYALIRAGVLAGTYFITGTDTGVGKTALTALLIRRLRARGLAARAVKPLCSGDRTDARVLRAAQDDALSLDEINPWHFRALIAPLLAARRQGARILLAEALAYLRRMRVDCDVLLVEGAGGLLSPLGEDFNARDVIAALRAVPLVVGVNRLGAINQALLVIAALPLAAARRSQVILMSPGHPDESSQSNAALLGETLGSNRVHLLPRFSRSELCGSTPLSRKVRNTLDALVDCASPKKNWHRKTLP